MHTMKDESKDMTKKKKKVAFHKICHSFKARAFFLTEADKISSQTIL